MNTQDIINYIDNTIKHDNINSWEDLLTEVITTGFSKDEKIDILNIAIEWSSSSNHINNTFKNHKS